MTSSPPPVVGIVGAIGAGKSTVAREIAGRCGGVVLDADRIGHEVLERQSVREQLRAAFGPDVLDQSGRVNRRHLAGLVFGNEPQQVEGRKRLEAIVHPEIRSDLRRKIGRVRSEPGVRLVLLDAAVMLEAGWSDVCDVIVYVDAPFETRLERVRDRGWTRAELLAREASQWPAEQKRAAAGIVVENTGDPSSAADRVLQLLQQYIPGEPVLCSPATS